MRQITKRKLSFDRDTIRRLDTKDLEIARGGASELQTCSVCGGLTGCLTANNC